MNISRMILSVLTALSAFVASAQAATLAVDLQGKGGFGLLPGNENATLAGTPGTGGELGSGILFNDVTNVLTINVGWGSANGFTNLTGNANGGHLHGPTASAGTAAFTEDAPVWIPLDSVTGWNPNATSGGFNGSVTLSDPQETALLQGRLYMNVHTPTNGGGEIRGNLVVVPEPSMVCYFAFAAAAFLLRRRPA
jgi:CHRD domain